MRASGLRFGPQPTSEADPTRRRLWMPRSLQPKRCSYATTADLRSDREGRNARRERSSVGTLVAWEAPGWEAPQPGMSHNARFGRRIVSVTGPAQLARGGW